MKLQARERPLRIAYIVGAFPTLSETFIVNQIVGMAARGHAVDVYTTAEEEMSAVSKDIERQGLTRRMYRLAGSSGRAANLIKTFALLLAVGWRAPAVVARTFAETWRHGFAGSNRLLYAALVLIERRLPRYDVIHAQFGLYGLLAMQLKRAGAMDGAIVTSFRGYDVGQYLKAQPDGYKDLFQTDALFLPVSRTLAECLVEAGCNPSKLRVHHSGIFCRRLAYRESHPADGPVRLITVARLVKKKGIAYAIQAVARVLASGKRVFYTVVGEGPQRRELEDLASRLGVHEHVRLAGSKPHDATLNMIRAAHILLAPSVTAVDGDTEGIPNVLKEAMATGLPVVATRHGGIAELVEDGVSGFLVPERDAGALAERLMHLIAHPERWPAMGGAGRAKVEAEFDIERLNLELEMLYNDAIDENRVKYQSEAVNVYEKVNARVT